MVVLNNSPTSYHLDVPVRGLFNDGMILHDVFSSLIAPKGLSDPAAKPLDRQIQRERVSKDSNW